MKYSEKAIKEWKVAIETQKADEKYLKENSVSCPDCGIPIIVCLLQIFFVIDKKI